MARRPAASVASVQQVWYACYGSNLDEQRFARYLRGGRAAGSRRVHDPCPEGTEWAGSRPVTVRNRLRFGRESSVWGGAVAFVDRVADPSVTTYGRGWLLSVAQWRHVVAQENRLSPGEVDGGRLVSGGTVCSGWYDEVLRCGDLDGVPLVTLTGDPGQPGVPSPAYLDTIRRGLAQCWPQLGADQVSAYLAAAMPTGTSR